MASHTSFPSAQPAEHAVAAAQPDAARNMRHSDDPCEDRLSRATDAVLTAATILTAWYVDPLSTVLGVAFALAFGNKEIKILPTQPQLASFVTKPYVKATCTAASLAVFPVQSSVSTFMLGSLMCCRMQRTKREPAIAALK